MLHTMLLFSLQQYPTHLDLHSFPTRRSSDLSFYDTADFDPGPGTYNLTSAGSSDIFISKLDSAGNFTWAKRLGGRSEEDTSELQSPDHLVCRLLLEKKKNQHNSYDDTNTTAT